MLRIAVDGVWRHSFATCAAAVLSPLVYGIWPFGRRARAERVDQEPEAAQQQDTNEEIDDCVDWGIQLATLGKTEPAAEWFKRAIERDPEDAAAHYNLGLALDELGRGSEAVESYARAAQLAPDDHEAGFALGCAYLANGSFKLAVESFREAVKTDPRDAQTRFNLAIALRKAGCPDLAEIELREFLALAQDQFPEHCAYARRLLVE